MTASVKIDYDLHIHTEYCGHAEGMSIDKILARADELELGVICIADHIYSSDELHIPAKIKSEVAGYKTECRVLVGAEIDVLGSCWDGSLVVSVPEGLDYVIAAVHYIPGVGNYPRSLCDGVIDAEVLLERWRMTLLGLLKNKQIDVLAHPARMVASAVELDLYFDRILEILEEAAPLAAKNNIMWELNEHDKDKIPADYHNRWYEIYKIALDRGVRLIYGSDSHTPEEIAGFEFVSKILQKLPDNSLEDPISAGIV